MDKQARYRRARSRGRSALTLLVLGAPLGWLWGCSSGGDGGGIGIASGQDPDPVVVDFPIAYVKRPIPLDEDGMQEQDDVREVITFSAGGDLYVRDRAAPSTPDENVTDRVTGGLGDVRDVEFSYDGARVVFAMRMPLLENVDDEDQPTWNIWEYEIETDTLRRVIASDITAEAGHDVDPVYLPDGRMVFSSTRQRQSKAILLDEGKPQFDALDEDENEPAFLLHVMEADGSGIKQISFNQSHDLDPSVNSDGQVVFTRWDHAVGHNEMSLYKMNPDGTGLELLYGSLSHATGTDGEIVQFLQPREMEDGRILTIVMPFTGTDFGGDIVLIDTANYIENTQPTAPNQGVLSGPAQEPGTVNNVRTDTQPSPGGRFSAALPLWDGTDRLMVSWSQCRLLEPLDPNAPPPDPDDPMAEPRVIIPCTADMLADPAVETAPPLYGIWIYDTVEETQLPIAPPEEGFIYTDIVAAMPRPTPPVILEGTPGVDLDADLVAEGVGILHIRSVYDVDGVDMAVPNIASLADPAQFTAAERPARFLRIDKIVSTADDDIVDPVNTAFGPNGGLGMVEILAYAPIEPDGSVKVKVPANVAFTINILDGNGRRISPRHNNWLQLRPGEERECQGCHDPASGMSHGRGEAFMPVWEGSIDTGVPFPNTEPAMFADFGETMADVRARISCSTDNCSALNPGVDIVYDDVWTDEAAAARAKDASFAWRYSALNTPPPTTLACLGTWSSLCRITIHYEMHIHGMWGVPRQILDVDGVTVLQDNTCISCHTPVDAAGMAQVPASQLDLTDGASDQEADHFKAYRELLFGDNEQEVVMDALVDRLVQVDIDPVTGDPIFATVPVAPSMRAGAAAISGQFFDRFAPGGTHAGRLTASELKILSEWVDIGAQYYNNPFLAPQN